MSIWNIDILTLFPQMFPGVLGYSVAQKSHGTHWRMRTHDIREYADNKHNTVDDTPYGGGAGMVMRADILGRCLDDTIGARRERPPVIYMSPRGRVLSQEYAHSLASGDGAVIICGRYEGVDQRFLDEYDVQEVSIGDYILLGGEVAAMALVECCIREIPGVLGNDETVKEESFCGEYENLLEYPHYTRPHEWRGRQVPPVLTSGNHAEIAKWRKEQAETITRARRPDLLA